MTADLTGLPLAIRHLRGEPSPEALWMLFKGAKYKQRMKLAARYFGPAKRGPKPLQLSRHLQQIERGAR